MTLVDLKSHSFDFVDKSIRAKYIKPELLLLKNSQNHTSLDVILFFLSNLSVLGYVVNWSHAPAKIG